MIGSMISLVYYLRVIAVMWMAPGDIEVPAAAVPAARTSRRVRPVAGWSPEADARAQPEVVAVAVVCAAAVIFFGIVPEPLLHLAREVGSAITSAL